MGHTLKQNTHIFALPGDSQHLPVSLKALYPGAELPGGPYNHNFISHLHTAAPDNPGDHGAPAADGKHIRHLHVEVLGRSGLRARLFFEQTKHHVCPL